MQEVCAKSVQSGQRLCLNLLIDGGAEFLADAIKSYLSEVRRFRSPKTLAACEHILRLFGSNFADRTLQSLKRENLLDHMSRLQQDGLAPRTIYNHIIRIKTFSARRASRGCSSQRMFPPTTSPRLRHTTRASSVPSSRLQNLEERLLFQFFPCHGLSRPRGPVLHLEERGLPGRVVSVRSKPELGFRPKDKEERSVPVPDHLVALIEGRKRESRSSFLFPGKNGKPDGHFLRTLQKLALRAGPNCGECLNKRKQSCRDHAICGQWGLHKFRKIFATMHSESGVSVPTIQRWLGHSDLATTLRYLAIADLRSDRTCNQVNASFAALSIGTANEP